MMFLIGARIYLILNFSEGLDLFCICILKLFYLNVFYVIKCREFNMGRDTEG